jgi:purple acid phosphatase-like protein
MKLRSVWLNLAISSTVVASLLFFAQDAFAYTLEYSQTNSAGTSRSWSNTLHYWYNINYGPGQPLNSDASYITKATVRLSQSDAGCRSQDLEMLLQDHVHGTTKTSSAMTTDLTGSEASYDFLFPSNTQTGTKDIGEIDVQETGGTNNCLGTHPITIYLSSGSTVGSWTTGYVGGSTTDDPAIWLYSGSGLPVISNIAVDPDFTSATVTWDTDVVADSTLCWGTTSQSTCIDYDHNGTQVESVTSHSFTISSGLLAGTTYHYRVCSEDGNGETCSSDATFTTDGGDPRGSPLAAVYDPPASPQRTFGADVINAYTFRAFVNIDEITYPGESVIFDYQIRAPDNTVLYDNPALPYLLDNSLICSSPGNCTVQYYAVLFDPPYGFEASNDYKIRIRAKTVSGGTYGDWSDDVTFTVQAAITIPGCDFWGAPPDGLACLWSWVEYALTPAGDAVSSLFSAFEARFTTRWPIAYIFDIIDAITDGINDTTPACPLPSVSSTEIEDVATLPGFDPCDIIDTATALLNDDSTVQTGGATLVYLIAVIALVVLAARFLNI